MQGCGGKRKRAVTPESEAGVAGRGGGAGGGAAAAAGQPRPAHHLRPAGQGRLQRRHGGRPGRWVIFPAVLTASSLAVISSVNENPVRYLNANFKLTYLKKSKEIPKCFTLIKLHAPRLFGRYCLLPQADVLHGRDDVHLTSVLVKRCRWKLYTCQLNRPHITQIMYSQLSSGQ